MAKKLTVKTDVGTFTRTTARTYTHIIVVKDHRREVLEAARLASLDYDTKHLAHDEQVLAGGEAGVAREKARKGWSEFYTLDYLRDSVERQRVEVAKQQTPITEDKQTDWFVLGWCGRLDLARKLFARQSTSGDSPARYRHAHIYDVATGKQVRW